MNKLRFYDAEDYNRFMDFINGIANTNHFISAFHASADDVFQDLDAERLRTAINEVNVILNMRAAWPQDIPFSDENVCEVMYILAVGRFPNVDPLDPDDERIETW